MPKKTPAQRLTRLKVCRWGHSFAVRIPAAAAKQLRLQPGSEVSVILETADREPTLDELLEGVTPERVGGEVDWGPAVGKEAW